MDHAEENIVKCPLVDALASPMTKSAIERIAGENYQNPRILLDQEYAKNNQIFLYQSDEGIQGFFMVGWSVIQCGGQELDTVFLGLSSVSGVQKGKGIGGKLYRAFVRDAQHWEAKTQRPLIWWFHTASSVVAHSWWKIASDIAPDSNGECSEDLLGKLSCIKAAHGMNRFGSKELPYLLKGYAKARYALSEVDRLSTLRAGLSEDLLVRLQVDERMGDRLLFVGRLPHNA
jgi:hypothetical protein